MLQFNKKYFLIATLIFVVEVLIALYIHDNIIRPYFGDILVVILIYCFIKAFLKTKVLSTALFVLLFAFTIEFLQYFQLVHLLGLEHNTFARIVIGTSFAWMDLLTYVMGVALVLLFEMRK